MTVDPGQLLRKLDPAVRPTARTGVSGAGRPPIESQSFGDMLALVADGRVVSDRAVGATESLPGEPLTDAQLRRIGAAADRAEAAGAKHAVLLVDGRGLLLDVSTREITGELGPDNSATAQPVHALDAAVYVTDDEENDAIDRAQRIIGPGRGVLPAAIAAQFADRLEDRLTASAVRDDDSEGPAASLAAG